MKLIKYFIQFIFIILLFLLFKILGLKLSKSFSSFIFKTIGPHFRSKKISRSNLTIAFPELDENEKMISRADMFSSPKELDDLYLKIDQISLKNNSFFGWIKSKLLPNKNN